MGRCQLSRYEGWVKLPGKKKKRYITLEWPLTGGPNHGYDTSCVQKSGQPEQMFSSYMSRQIYPNTLPSHSSLGARVIDAGCVVGILIVTPVCSNYYCLTITAVKVNENTQKTFQQTLFSQSDIPEFWFRIDNHGFYSVTDDYQ